MRLRDVFGNDPRLQMGIVGAGGKTTLMFRLAGEYSGPVVISASTHLSEAQLTLADWVQVVAGKEDLIEKLRKPIYGAMLFIGAVQEDGRAHGLPMDQLEYIHRFCLAEGIPLLVEADGSRMCPLKAPAAHEPALPEWVNTAAVVAGLSGLHHPLNSQWVHRPEIFAALSGLKMDQEIDAAALASVLVHPSGGLKNIPGKARRILILNQCDTADLVADAQLISDAVRTEYDTVALCQFNDKLNPVKKIIENRRSVCH